MDLIVNNIQLQFMNYISTHFKLDNLQYQLLVNTLGYFINKCKNILSLTELPLSDVYNNMYIIILFIFSCISIISIYKIYIYYYYNYQIITIANNDKYKDILYKYMNLNKEIFKTENVDFLLDDKYTKDKNIYCGKVYFNDTILNRKGYLCVENYKFKTEKEIYNLIDTKIYKLYSMTFINDKWCVKVPSEHVDTYAKENMKHL